MSALPLILDDMVKKVGEHYLSIGEHSDLWRGEIVIPSDSANAKTVAIKVLRGGTISKPKFKENLGRALEKSGHIWKTLDHIHVAQFYGLAFNCGIMPALILEFYSNGNVNEYLKREPLEDDTKSRLVKEVALGIRYLHHHRIIHGDIRGANVLIDDEGRAVLTDYGLVFVIDSADFTTTKIVGTCRWTAPELMSPPQANEEELAPPYSFASDIFAFAMTSIEIFTGRPPFAEKRSDTAVLFAILAGKRPEIPAQILEKSDIASVVRESWAQDHRKRPSADKICATFGAEPAPEMPPVSTGWFGYLLTPVYKFKSLVWRS